MSTAFNSHPTLIVRARLNPAVMEEFELWHRQTHLPHVLQIPGIVAARRVRAANPMQGSHLMAYEFADDSSVQAALASSEAQVARRDWDRWADDVYELSIEIYAPLSPLPAFHHRN